MAKRGPKPATNEQKALEGNPGKRKLVAQVDEDDLSSGSLRMPTRLTEYERQIWRDTLEAFPSWYFRPADKALLIAYCRAVTRLEKSEKALQNKSAVEKRANGSPCISPHVAIINAALAQVMALSDQLGISRKTRKGVQAPSAPPSPYPGEVTPDFPAGGEQDIPDYLIAGPI